MAPFRPGGDKIVYFLHTDTALSLSEWLPPKQKGRGRGRKTSRRLQTKRLPQELCTAADLDSGGGTTESESTSTEKCSHASSDVSVFMDMALDDNVDATLSEAKSESAA
eukprot:7382716-Lingulodinium_polyedra.AAC.1